MNQGRLAAIVGIHEYPDRDVMGELSALQIKAQSAARALTDAGLNWSDVDAIYDAGEGGGMSGLNISEYFGISPRVIDTTAVGGSSYQFHAAHALRDIAAGKARVALLTYGSTAHSDRRAIGVGGRAAGGLHPADNLDGFAGSTLIANYAMVAQRHMFDHGTTSAQLAEISVATRLHAMRNPDAVRAMEDLEFLDIRETTIDDVLNSRVIADPLHLLECCMISDGGGAVVIFDKKSNQPPESYPLKRTPLSIILAERVDLGRARMVTGHSFDGTATVVTAQDPDNPEYGNIQMLFTGKPVELRQWVINDAGGSQTTVVLGALKKGGSLRNALFDTGTASGSVNR